MKPDKAHRAVDRRIASMERRLQAEYSRLYRKVRSRFMDEVGRLKGLEATLEGDELLEAKRRRLVYDTKARARMQSLARLMTETNAQILRSLDEDSMAVYVLGWNSMNDRLESLGLPFSVLDEGTLRTLMKEQTDLLPKSRLMKSKDYAWNLRRIRAELLDGIKDGEGIEKLADRLRKVVAMDLNSSVRNARTLMTRVENQARADRFDDDADRFEQYGYKSVKVWISTPDERTRPHHRELNGRTAGRDGTFGYGLRYPADPQADPSEVWNCRCSLGVKLVKVKG